jgi:uncharacterized protein YndB with AHSA1/START domain
MKLNAEPETVFQALSDAAQLVKWFPSKAESDARTGGRLRLEWEFKETEKNGFQESQYTNVIENELLAYTWDASGQATEVTVRLSPDGGGTELALTHMGWEPGMDEAAEMHGQIWSGYLQNLKMYLEEGGDMRPEAMGQITY